MKEDLKKLKGSYWITRILYIRCITFIYMVAFLVAYLQNKELIGERGLTPVSLFMQRIEAGMGSSDGWASRVLAAPTIFWMLAPTFEHVDWWLDGISVAGLGLSMVVFITGAANMICMACLWGLYFSIVSVGQTWYSFGWESMLLEAGFLAIWSVPLLSLNQLPNNFPTPWLVVAGNRWFLFRVMLGAGLIKIRGDPCWKDLTCMNYFYETQPVPNPLTYYAHHSPEIFHKLETLSNHVVELFVPWLVFIPLRPVNIFVGVSQILFQCILVGTGNLSFLNWLTMVPSIYFFDDYFWSGFVSQNFSKKVLLYSTRSDARMSPIPSRFRMIVNAGVCMLIAYLSIPIVRNMVSQHQVMNMSYNPLRIVNTYGAFGSVSKERTEVILFGTNSPDPSDPSSLWLEYEFNCKPGKLSKRPCIISPYHYRLDWLMWFLAFQPYQHNPWLLHVIGKLLTQPAEINSLLSVNPFPTSEPPKFIVAAKFRYSFTKPGSPEAVKGEWWTREYIGEYVPAVDFAALEPAYRQMGWRK
ncbi:unnamed protein product [Ectocarpus fasciculatus]